jgi:hypothetical protein
VAQLLRLPGDPAGHDAAPHVHLAAEHVPARPRAPQGRHEGHAEPDGDRARELRRLHRRGLHLEAAARHRRLHHVRPLHQRVPGPRHRQAARPPRDRAQDRRGHGRHRHPAGVAPDRHDPEITIGANSLFERITPEEVWACTTCKACDEICPVNIEILDKILDMRRYLSLMESNFPTELGNAYRSMENSGNPWGMSQAERADWAKGRRHRDRRRQRPFDHEYLYWVGCAGLRRQEPEGHPGHGQAAAAGRHRLRHPRPVENCTGDPARRSGNEYIFQMLAMQNIETLNGMGVKKIITQCPTASTRCSTSTRSSAATTRWCTTASSSSGSSRPGKLDLTGPASTSGSCTTTPATSAATTTSTCRPARSSAASAASRSSRPAQRHQGHVLRRRRRPHVDGGDTGKKVNDERSEELHRHRRQPHRHRLPLLLHHDRRRREGRRQEDDEVKVADIAMHLLEAIEAGEHPGRCWSTSTVCWWCRGSRCQARSTPCGPCTPPDCPSGS